MNISQFQELDIWKDSSNFAVKIYQITSEGKISKDFSFRNQIRRCAVSISANIAEGFDRKSNKEFIRFLNISQGSLSELRSHLAIAMKINYFTNTEYELLDSELAVLAKRIGKLRKYLKESNPKLSTHNSQPETNNP